MQKVVLYLRLRTVLTIGGVGREVKLLTGYSRRKVCFAYRGMVSKILHPRQAKVAAP